MASRTALKLMRLARGNDAAAQTELGRLYLAGGEGISANTDAALMWLERAAAAGHAEAAQAIARDISPRLLAQPARLLRFYEAAANQGDARAAFHAALVWRSLESAESDARYRHYLSQAAQQGLSEAQVLLAELIDSGHGGDARELLSRAAASGSDEALAALAERAWAKRDPAGLDALRRVAHKGHPESVYRYGLLLRDAHTTPAQLAEATEWLMRAADAGHAGARHACGAMLAGLAPGAVRRNYKRAARWLEQALEDGVAEAGLTLARLHAQPRFVGRNAATAQAALLRAAQLGHAESQFELGRSLYTEWKRAKFSTPAALLDAARWLRESALQAHPEAAALFAQIASPPPHYTEAARGYQQSVLDAIGARHAGIALRVQLMADFGLRKNEALMFNPGAADHANFLLIDASGEDRATRPRLVQIATEAQRALIDRAKTTLDDTGASEADVSGAYAARYRKLAAIATRHNLDWARFFERVDADAAAWAQT